MPLLASDAATQVLPLEQDQASLRGVGLATRKKAVAMDEHPSWPIVAQVPISVSVTVAMSRLKVRDLLGLRVGQTVSSAWPITEDVPLLAANAQIFWGEFELAGQRMALRLTRLA